MMLPTRLLAFALGSLVAMEAAGSSSNEDLYDTITDRAERLADEPYNDAAPTIPPALAELDYDQYRQIRFRPEDAIWHDQGLFEVQLFHPGFLYDRPVTLNLVDPDGDVQPLPFETSHFRYDGETDELAKLDLDDLGYAASASTIP